MTSEPVTAENRRKRTAYVCNIGSTDDKSGWISVIDLESRTMTKNIDVGMFPVFSLVYPHDRKKLIVTLHNYTYMEGGGVLVLVDLQTSKVIQKEPYTGKAVPTGMVYDEMRDILYVADENQTQQPRRYLFSWDNIPGNDNERLIDFLKQKFDIKWVKIAKIEKIDDGRTIRVSTEKNSLSLKLNDEKTKINLEIDDGRTDKFIAKMEDNKLNIYSQGYVHVHDGKTLKFLYSFLAGSATAHVDISSDGRHLVATNRNSFDLSVFDLEKDPVIAQNGITIPIGDPDTCHPYDVKFSGNPDICYVTDYETGELLVVDITRRIVTDRIKIGEKLFGMALDKVGTTAYVCDFKSNSVSIIDMNSKKIIDKITNLQGFPSHCAIDEEGRQLVVACQVAVHIIDLVTKTVVATIVDERLQGSMGVTIEA